MGLLDILGTSWDDPKTMAALQLAGGLLGGQGNTMQRLALGLNAYGATMGAAKKAQQDEEERKALLAQRAAQEQRAQQQFVLQQQLGGLQVAQAARADADAQTQRELDDAFIKKLPSPQAQALQALGANASPTMANATRMPAVDPRQQFLYDAVQARLLKPMEYLTATAKDDAPIKLGPDEVLLSGRSSGYKPLAQGLPKASDTPAAIREYEYAKKQGYQGTFQQFQTEQKKAGATNVSVSMDKGFGDAFAKDAASMLATSRDQAQAAANNLRTLNRIDEVVNSGKVVVGPTAKFETFGRQLGQSLGVTGKDNAEVLGNTRKLLQGAASLAADGAKLLAGQGQITEGERALISRAAGGDIDSMTVPEIQSLSTVLRKVNSFKVQQHDAALKNVGPQFAPFVPFYKVQMPEAPAVDFGSLK